MIESNDQKGVLIGVLVVVIVVFIALLCAAPGAQKTPPHNSERIAVTDDGTKVYKVTGPGTVVPVVVAVSPQGHVAVR